MLLSVKPMAEWTSHGAEPYVATTNFHYMRNSLWLTYSTTGCDHPSTAGKAISPVKLGPETAAMLGWSNLKEVV
jgi:hypothetical protein